MNPYMNIIDEFSGTPPPQKNSVETSDQFSVNNHLRPPSHIERILSTDDLLDDMVDRVHEGHSLIPSNKKASADDEIRTGTIFSAIFNLTNGIMGAGMLSFPYSFYCTGTIAGLFISFFIIFFVLIGLKILMICNFDSSSGGLRTYQLCMQKHLGFFFKRLAEIVTLINVTGILITYFIIISEFIEPVMLLLVPPSFFLANRKVLSIIFGVGIIYPLVLLREIKKLGFTSFLGIIGTIFLSLVVSVNGIWEVFLHWRWGPGMKEYLFIQTQTTEGFWPILFLALPMQCFGYVCHAMIFPISYELKNTSPRKMDIVYGVSITICATVYISTGLLGWFAFGSGAQQNILDNFSGANVFANSARFAMGVVITFSFPIQNYSGRLALKTLSEMFGANKDKEWGTKTFLLIQTIYFLLCLLAALCIPGIAIMFGFTGAIGCSTLMFLFPGCLCFTTIRRKTSHFLGKIGSILGGMIEKGIRMLTKKEQQQQEKGKSVGKIVGIVMGVLFSFHLGIMFILVWMFFASTGFISSLFKLIDSIK